MHGIYGLIQLGYFSGTLGNVWVTLDDIYAAQNFRSWFFYPRLTGLQVNPNSYGLYAAFVFVLLIAIKTTLFPVKGWFWWFGLVSAIFGIAFSSSRSALIGLMVALLILSLTSFTRGQLVVRNLMFGGRLTAIGMAVFASIWLIMPPTLQMRFERFGNVFMQGAEADVNALARVDEWRELWNIYWSDYMFGTWVPASYATGSGIDSFYIATAIQGTPVFTLAWLLFLGAVVVIGLKIYSREDISVGATIGFVLLGWVGVMAGGGLTLSPMLQPQLIVPFWVMIGVALASVSPVTRGVRVAWRA